MTGSVEAVAVAIVRLVSLSWELHSGPVQCSPGLWRLKVIRPQEASPGAIAV